MAARDGVILQGNPAPPRTQHNQKQQRSSLDMTVDCSTLVSPSQLKKRLPSAQLAAQRLLQQALEQSDDNLRFAMLMQVVEGWNGVWLKQSVTVWSRLKPQ